MTSRAQRDHECKHEAAAHCDYPHDLCKRSEDIERLREQLAHYSIDEHDASCPPSCAFQAVYAERDSLLRELKDRAASSAVNDRLREHVLALEAQLVAERAMATKWAGMCGESDATVFHLREHVRVLREALEECAYDAGDNDESHVGEFKDIRRVARDALARTVPEP